MRPAILVLCVLQFLAFGVMFFSALTANSDAAGNGMAMGFATVAGGLVLVFTLPAFLLALSRTALRVALVLSLVIPVFSIWVVSQGIL